MTTTATTTAAVQSSPRGARGFRPDVQGLRAIAVVLVLAFHAGIPGLDGGYVGVDVFFVISGFLITSMIVAEVRKTGHLRLGRFYARRARRLLPAAMTVLVATGIATLLWLPVTRWREIAGDMASTTVYLINWRLANRSVDYLAQGSAASPLQHFWSLAVEEQFYVVWPLLVLAVAVVARRLGRQVRTSMLLGGILVIAVPSLLWSIHLTATEADKAYFVTTTRLWELAVGALLAVGAAHVARLSQRVLLGAGFLGLAMIAYATLRFTGETPFPGSAALVPTVGAALVLASGLRDQRGLAPLRLPFMQTIGALSYSLYLWHWPAIVIATAVWGDSSGHLRIRYGVLAIALSVVPAWLAYRFIEQPIHLAPALRDSVRRSAFVGVACTAVGLAAAGGVALAVPSGYDGTAPGASVIGTPAWTGAADPDTKLNAIQPSLADAAGDVADVYADGCHRSRLQSDVKACVYGDPGSDVVVALVGDSHAGQWQPPLRKIAEEQGWRLETYTKSSCAFAPVDQWLNVLKRPYTECTDWNKAMTAALLADPPTMVVTSNDSVDALVVDGQKTAPDTLDADVADALAASYSTMQDAGIPVAVIGDTPWIKMDVPECVATHEDAWIAQCTESREKAVGHSSIAQQEAAASKAGVPLIDLDDYICPGDACPAIIGDAFVWRADHHITATYARTLAPRLATQLVPLVDAAR